MLFFKIETCFVASMQQLVSNREQCIEHDFKDLQSLSLIEQVTKLPLHPSKLFHFLRNLDRCQLDNHGSQT